MSISVSMRDGGRSSRKSTPAGGQSLPRVGPSPRSLHCGRLPVRMWAPTSAAGGGTDVRSRSSRQSHAAQGGEVRELRLAVVLYGGASLAIYMHGTTKELQRLVKASALADRGGAATTASERVYGELLAELAGRDPAGVRTRVVVDVVAGTSAGGINGVYLSKALAHNRSQDSLRDLWLDRGDIKVLLRGPELAAGVPEGAAASRRRRQEAGAQGRRDRAMDVRGAPRHGRGRLAAGRARDADAAVAPARALRHGDRLPRLPPRRCDRRPEADRRAGAPARALVPPRRRRRPVRSRPQRRARLLGAYDDELPRRVPAGQPGVVPGGDREGGRRRLAGAARALPDLRARARGPARDVLHRRRRARQQALRPRDRRDHAAGRRVRGRAAAALPRAGPGRRRRRRAGRRLAEPDRDHPRVDLGPATSRSPCSTTSSRSTGTTSASCESRRSSRRPSTRSAGGSRRSSAPSSIGSHASSRRPTSCSGAPGSTRTQRRPQASPTRPTSAAR